MEASCDSLFLQTVTGQVHTVNVCGGEQMVFKWM